MSEKCIENYLKSKPLWYRLFVAHFHIICRTEEGVTFVSVSRPFALGLDMIVAMFLLGLVAWISKVLGWMV